MLCGMVILFTNKSHGIINLAIQLLGGIATAFMQEPQMFKWIYVLSGIWQNSGWGTIIYFAALSGVDQSLVDAAAVDGASRFQRIIQNSLNISGSEIISTYVYKLGLLNYDYAFSTAAGLFNSICNAIILVTANGISRKVSGSGLW